ncbi:PREDICTED: chymotrypsin-2-like [Ceratosolen solmsi marchali]|uniref:trypsin n=1 Tax=Ceratosolen solmsi marchali TaxID=326594 RepID=A0AAJ7E2C4_9HYME|nr:PREDICTED: chymotrypsin-2-like [Ceratosolen solmsi marchali]
MNFQLIIIVCLSINDVVFSKRLRIVGGIDTNIKEYPYTISLRLQAAQHLICGGAIISQQHILTAAHCFDDTRLYEISVYIGTSLSTNYTMPYYRVCNVHAHPKYDAKNEMAMKAQYDIAVAVVVPRIILNEYQNVVSLPRRNVGVGKTGVITGWGKTGYPIGDTSEVIQMQTMTIIKNSECQKYLPFPLHSDQLCAFQRKGVGACYGDSGAPLVVDGKIVAVSSFVRPCAIGEPDIYVRVYAYLNFIKQSMDCPSTSCCLS